MTAFTVNVLLTCILNLRRARLLVELFASTVDRFLSRVSYLPSDPTFLCGLHEVYSHIMVSPDLFLYLFIYVFIYLSTRVERLSRGLV